jgi:hypothetical protein
MSSHQDHPDELQKIWQKNCAALGKDDYSMTIKLLQEKQLSFRDFVHGDDYAGYMVILMCAPLSAIGAWKAHPLLSMQLGYLIWTVLFIAGAMVVWIAERKSRAMCKIDLSIRAYHRELQQLHEKRIHFLRSIKYWFAIPFVFGIYFVLSPVARYILSKPWDIILVISLMMLFWLGVWYQNDIRGVRQIQNRKHEVDALLDQIDQS